MNNYEKALSNAEKDLQKYVEKKDWSEANKRSGYLDGIKSFKFHFDNMSKEERENRWTRAQFERNFAIEHGDYGLAANLAAWFSGWESAETSCRLDELESMVK